MALIYIVEDDPSIQEIEVMALKNSNYMVQAFDRASSLYDKLEEVVPNLILLDIMLPDEDGYKIVRRLRNNPKTRLSLIALIAIITTTVGITSVYYNLFQRQVRNDLKQNAVLLVETELFQNAYSFGKESAENLAHLSSGNLRITWVDEDGTVLFDNDTDIAGLSNHLDRPEIQMAFENGEGESTRRSDTMNMNTFYYALLLDNGTVLRVSTQARTIISVLITALPVIAGILALVLLVCVLIGHLLTGQLMKPIEEMAEHLDDGSRSPAYRELEPFADKIRNQHENILAAAKSRQDFTANVSHELKTPITAISGYAELIENRLIDSEAEVHVASQIRHNADRLLSLVTDIIQLSELDHRELPRKFEQLDLFSVARECVNEHVLMASQRNIKLICSGTSAGIPMPVSSTEIIGCPFSIVT